MKISTVFLGMSAFALSACGADESGNDLVIGSENQTRTVFVTLDGAKDDIFPMLTALGEEDLVIETTHSQFRADQNIQAVEIRFNDRISQERLDKLKREATAKGLDYKTRIVTEFS